jgi:hypothetical protein
MQLPTIKEKAAIMVKLLHRGFLLWLVAVFPLSKQELVSLASGGLRQVFRDT